MDEELEKILSALPKRGRKSKFNFTKEELQKCVDELESKGTYPNRLRLYAAVERSELGRKNLLKAVQINGLVNKFGIILKTKPGKKGRRKKNQSTSHPREADSKINPTAPESNLIKGKREKAPKPVGMVLRKLEQICDEQLSREFSIAMGANGRVIFIKPGPPYYSSMKDIPLWIKINMNRGLAERLLLYPTVFYKWAQREFPTYDKKYEEIRNQICEFFVNQGLGKFI